MTSTPAGGAGLMGMNLPAARQVVEELDDLLKRLGAIAAQLAATRALPTDYSVTGAALAAAAEAKQTQIWQTLLKLAGLVTAKREALSAAIDAVEKHDEESAAEHQDSVSHLHHTVTA